MSNYQETERGKQSIELLYWIGWFISRYEDGNIAHPVDLWAVNKQFYKNWGGQYMPIHLHPVIPDLLHELMASGMVLDHPENWPDAPLAGRFEEAESRNGGRISIYDPGSFQVYFSAYGYAALEYEVEKGDLGKALTRNGDVVGWERIATDTQDNSNAFNAATKRADNPAGADNQTVKAAFLGDEDEELAFLAKKYGDRLGRNLRTTTIQAWLSIATHRRRVVNGEVSWLTDAKVEQRTGIIKDTYATHKKDMKKSGFWRDYKLDPE